MVEERVTLYNKDELLGNIIKTECRRVEIERRAYAQYRNAISVRFVRKGARKERGFVDTYRSRLLVLKGWGHPDPAGLFDGGERDGIAVKAKYMAFDEGWERDFNDLIDDHVATTGAEVVWDSRGEVIN